VVAVAEFSCRSQTSPSREVERQVHELAGQMRIDRPRILKHKHGGGARCMVLSITLTLTPPPAFSAFMPRLPASAPQAPGAPEPSRARSRPACYAECTAPWSFAPALRKFHSSVCTAMMERSGNGGGRTCFEASMFGGRRPAVECDTVQPDHLHVAQAVLERKLGTYQFSRGCHLHPCVQYWTI